MKSVFPIAFFGLFVSGCVNIEARMPDVEHPDWIEERRAEQLETSGPPPVVPIEGVSRQTVSGLDQSMRRIQRERARLDRIMDEADGDPETAADEFVVEGRSQTGAPD